MQLSRTQFVLLALVVVFGASGAASSIALQESHDGGLVLAEFRDVSPVLPRLEVKMHGVTVGSTGQPWMDEERGVAVLPLNLEPEAFPVHRDARAKVAPVSLLGEKFIELDPGSASAPALAPGERLPVSRTSQPVEFQDVVDSLDDPTASALAALTVTFGQAMDGNGKDVQRTMAALAPALRDADQLVKVLKSQNGLLGRVVDQVQPVTSALASERGKALDQLIGAAHRVLGSAAVKDQALDATIAELPATLAEARKTLTDLAGASSSTSTTLHALRPTTNDLAALSKELQLFSEAADPALATLNPVLDRASELLDQARPVVHRLRQGGPGLRSTVRHSRSIVGDLDDNLGNVLGFIRNWALTTNGRDGLSHYFRAHYVVASQQGTGLVPGGDPIRRPPPENERDPRPRDDTPPTGLLNGFDSPSGGATGLSSEQEQGALEFLLGGS